MINPGDEIRVSGMGWMGFCLLIIMMMTCRIDRTLDKICKKIECNPATTIIQEDP